MKNRSLISTISLILLGFVFGVFLVSNFSWERSGKVQIGADNPPVDKINVDAQKFNNAFMEVAEKVTPSIVQIQVVSSEKIEMPTEMAPFHKFFFGPKGDSPQESQKGGSGVIISDDGYIITNNHVVENATKVTVTLVDKREFDAIVVGTDPNTDLAVIKIQTKDLPEVYFGDSDKARIGEWVMAIGNPMSFASTVTAGIISARGRNLDIIRKNTKDNFSIEDFIQTDAAINPGNSGGALVDLSGSLIGINTAIATNGITGSYIGYGFAIPINLAKNVARDLIEFGKVKRGFIGVSISEVDASYAKAVGLDKPRGIVIQSLVKDGAASKADIKEGDILLSIDGRELYQPNELQSYVGTKRAGDEVKLKLFRGGKEITRTVRLEPRDEDEESAGTSLDSKLKGTPKKKDKIQTKEFTNIGLSVKDLNQQEKNDYKVESGILITNVTQFGKAQNQRLFKDLVISEVNQNKLGSVEEFTKIINNNVGKAIILKVVDKTGTSRYVGLEIPE